MIGELPRPLKALFDRFAAALGYKVAGPIDYLARYPGKVVAQSGDLSRVDVQLDIDVQGSARRMPSPSNISIRLGLPGVTVEVQTGCRVLVGWEQGDQDKPYIADWELGATVLTLNVAANAEINVTGGEINLTAAAAKTVNINSGALAAVKFNGGGRQVAAQGDTAGPYPLACTGLFVERS